jgi:hypothetical protein
VQDEGGASPPEHGHDIDVGIWCPGAEDGVLRQPEEIAGELLGGSPVSGSVTTVPTKRRMALSEVAGSQRRSELAKDCLPRRAVLGQKSSSVPMSTSF